jgi:hypothetical protein
MRKIPNSVLRGMESTIWCENSSRKVILGGTSRTRSEGDKKKTIMRKIDRRKEGQCESIFESDSTHQLDLNSDDFSIQRSNRTFSDTYVCRHSNSFPSEHNSTSALFDSF